MNRAIAVGALLLLGCGGDDDGGGPDAGGAGGPDAALSGEIGSADVTGTLVEQAIEPAAAFYGLHPVGGYEVLVMHEDPAAFCAFATDGAGLAAIIGFPCGGAAAGTLLINPDVEAPCGEQPHVWFLV